jgi:hypothetical protein
MFKCDVSFARKWMFSFTSENYSTEAGISPEEPDRCGLSPDLDVIIKGDYSMDNFSPLMCVQKPHGSLLFCGGETRNTSSTKHSFSFVGCPIHVIDLDNIKS